MKMNRTNGNLRGGMKLKVFKMRSAKDLPENKLLSLLSRLIVIALCVSGLVFEYNCWIKQQAKEEDAKPSSNLTNLRKVLEERISSLANSTKCNQEWMNHVSEKDPNKILQSNDGCSPDLLVQIDRGVPKNNDSTHFIVAAPSKLRETLIQTAIQEDLIRQKAIIDSLEENEKKQRKEDNKNADSDQFLKLIKTSSTIALLIPLVIAFWQIIAIILGDKTWIPEYKPESSGREAGNAVTKILSVIPIAILGGGIASASYQAFSNEVPSVKLSDFNHTLMSENSGKIHSQETWTAMSNLFIQPVFQKEDRSKEIITAIENNGKAQISASTIYANAHEANLNNMKDELKKLAQHDIKLAHALNKTNTQIDVTSKTVKANSDQITSSINTLTHVTAQNLLDIDYIQKISVRADQATRNTSRVIVKELVTCGDKPPEDDSLHIFCIFPDSTKNTSSN